MGNDFVKRARVLRTTQMFPWVLAVGLAAMPAVSRGEEKAQKPKPARSGAPISPPATAPVKAPAPPATGVQSLGQQGAESAEQNASGAIADWATMLSEQARQLQRACTKSPAAAGNAAIQAATECNAYCLSPQNSEGKKFRRLCALDDPLLALSVALSDPTEIADFFKKVNTSLEAAGVTKRQEDGPTQTSPSPFVIPGIGSDFAAVALQGLAKLIADRAKQEATGWFLDQLGESVCNDARHPMAGELKTYWLPSICALRAEVPLGTYGAGAEMLEGLRQALVADAQRWPGTAAGIGVGALFLADVNAAADDAPADPIRCARDERPVCSAVKRLRLATADRLTAVIGGRSAMGEFAALSQQFDNANRNGEKFFSPGLQVGACALGFPLAFSEFANVVNATSSVRVQAPALAALVTVPACAALTVGAVDMSTKSVALRHLDVYERLARSIGAWNGLTSHAAELQAAVDEYQEAVKAGKGAQSPLGESKLPQFDGASPEAAAAGVEAYLSNVSRALSASAYARVVGAALGVGESALALGSASIGFVRNSSKIAEQLPGLCEKTKDSGSGGANGSFCDGPELQTALDRADLQVARIQQGLAAIQRVVSGQWGQGLALILAALGREIDGLATPTGKANRSAALAVATGAQRRAGENLADVRATLARHGGKLVALLQAKDGDEAARALDTMANPPGGWRIKARHGARTLALVAQPGFYVAGELRNGQYGANMENGRTPYFQPPALAFPVGLELSFGHCGQSHGLFVPLLDPAAFLQYDASESGRLPGASLKTALSPGLGYRVGIPESPFSVTPLFVYRPAFRAWTSQLDAPGADAFQAGLLFSIDVTLYGATKEAAPMPNREQNSAAAKESDRKTRKAGNWNVEAL